MTEQSVTNDLVANIDSLTMGIVVIDQNLTIEFLNPALTATWDVGPDTLTVGSNLGTLFQETYLQNFSNGDKSELEAFTEARVREIQEETSPPFQIMPSEAVTLLCSVTNLGNNRKLISYLDISNTKHSSQSAPLSEDVKNKYEQQIAESIEALEDGFVLFDENDELVICNEAFKDQFRDVPGIDAYMVEGVSYRDMTMQLACSGLIPGIEGKEAEFVENLIQTRRSQMGIEKTFKTHDGKWIKQRDTQTQSGGVVGVRIDVTDLKEGEEKLSKANALLSATSKAMPQGLLVFNEGKVEYFNKQMLSLFEIPEENSEVWVGQSIENFVEHHLARLNTDKPEEVSKRILSTVEHGNNYSLEHTLPSGKAIRIDGVGQENGSYLYTYTDISNQKKIQDELARREELLNSILTASENGILVTNGFDEIITYNSKALNLLGSKNEETISRNTYRDLLTLQYHQKSYLMLTENEVSLEDFLDNAMSVSRSALEKVKTLLMANGDTFRYRVRKLDNGYLVHSYVDITSEKQREAELENARLEAEKISAIQTVSANSMAQGLLFFKEKHLQFFNQKFLDLVGADPDSIYLGMHINELLEILGRIGKFADEMAEKTYKEQVIHNFEQNASYQIIRQMQNGNILQIDVVAKDNGDLVATYSDITEVKNNEAELEIAKAQTEAAMVEVHKNQEMFEAFAKTNSDWFWKMDSRLRFSYFSDQFTAVTGVDPHLLIGKSRRDTGVPGVEPEVFEEHLRTLDAHEPFRDFVHSRTKECGTEIWLSISGSPVFNSSGEFEGYVGSGRDVTDSNRKQIELKEAKHAAEMAERAKSEFLANMSHEIRTPMNGVMGMAELLATTDLDAKQKMFTDVIVKSGASLLTIINDILDFSKIDAGQLELDIAPFNMRESIEDVATLVSAKVAEKDLELIVRVKPELPNMLMGDVGRFRQIVTNLLGNAVKFTEKGHIYVNIDGSVNDNGTASLQCSVEDTGIGIPKEKCSQIFQKFSQVDTSATRKHEGTGLGLSIASSLVELMGGQIKVESEVGTGTIFSFTIDMQVHGEELNRAAIIPGDMEGARILIIDDNEVNRSILTEQMAAWKFDSASAADGQEGLNVIRAVIQNKMNLDLIILDYQMPGMTGADVLETLRNDPELRHIPVIMLTSVDSSETNKRFAAMGAEANLTKPTRSSLLLETIMQVIANHRAAVQHYAPKPIANSTTPQHDAKHQEQPLDTAEPQGIETCELDVLVAEDNEVNQIVFRQILEELGIAFKIVENGRLAVAAYRADKPKMILMDVSMPEMNGQEATRAIRKLEQEANEKRIPVIGVTAHALKGDMEACIDAGMDDYLSKPVSPSKLALKIEQWLKLDTSRQVSV